jgi:hypothetical protein
MRSLRAWIVRLGGVFTGERRDRDFDAELDSHLQLHTPRDGKWMGNR